MRRYRWQYEIAEPDFRMRAETVKTLYADGGCVLANPSKVGGSFAFCGVATLDPRPLLAFACPGGLDAGRERVIEARGYILRHELGLPLVTNNHTELIAAVCALEAMPPGWSGRLCTDSNCTIGRMFRGERLKNVPGWLSARMAAALKRAGRVEPVLLKGHPPRRALADGWLSGKPVSEHNVWCDLACGLENEHVVRIETARLGREQESIYA